MDKYDGSLSISRSDSVSFEASDSSRSELRLSGKIRTSRYDSDEADGNIERRIRSYQHTQSNSLSNDLQGDDDRQTVASSQSRAAELLRVKNILSNKSDSRYMSMSPCTTENLARLREVTSRSISRSRQRKEAAEERLKSLIHVATRSDSFEESSLFRGSSDDASRGSRESRSSRHSRASERRLPPSINRNLFGTENDENNLVRPRPRKTIPPSKGNSNTLTEIGNIKMPSSLSMLTARNEKEEKQHYSQQTNISVMDNFFIFKL